MVEPAFALDEIGGERAEAGERRNRDQRLAGIVAREPQGADGEDEGEERPRRGEQGRNRLADRRVEVEADRQDVGDVIGKRVRDERDIGEAERRRDIIFDRFQRSAPKPARRTR